VPQRKSLTGIIFQRDFLRVGRGFAQLARQDFAAVLELLIARQLNARRQPRRTISRERTVFQWYYQTFGFMTDGSTFATAAAVMLIGTLAMYAITRAREFLILFVTTLMYLIPFVWH
jgi:hypothetical protein